MDSRIKGYLRKNLTLPCNICKCNIDNEINYGPMYTIKSITCHYFCILLSSRMLQRGNDNEGIVGFLHEDILKIIRSSRSQRCVYCSRTGATIWCCSSHCRRAFHLPCGINNGALFLFYDTYQSFCVSHRQNQIIPKNIVDRRKRPILKLERINLEQLKRVNNRYIVKGYKNRKRNGRKRTFDDNTCSICLESVVPYLLRDTFWPSCCKANQWFHRNCLSKLALSAGEYFVRCPLCNNNKEFIEELLKFGIYIPSRDASWEREQGAFAELLERPNICTWEICLCREGRKYNKSKKWEMIICSVCGSDAVHKQCASIVNNSYECINCIVTTKKLEERSQSSSEVDTTDNIENSLYDSFDENEEIEVELPGVDLRYDVSNKIQLQRINESGCSETTIMQLDDDDKEISVAEHVSETTAAENKENSSVMCNNRDSQSVGYSNLKFEWKFLSGIKSKICRPKKNKPKIFQLSPQNNKINKYFFRIN